MQFLKGRCPRCGGNLYRDEDGAIRCSACERELSVAEWIDMMFPVPKLTLCATGAEMGNEF